MYHQTPELFRGNRKNNSKRGSVAKRRDNSTRNKRNERKPDTYEDVKSAFTELCKTPLVIHKQENDDHLTSFQYIINNVVLDSPERKRTKKMIIAMYHSNPGGFMDFMKGSDCAFYILFGNSKMIAEFFGIDELVDISYDKTSNRYFVQWLSPDINDEVVIEPFKWDESSG